MSEADVFAAIKADAAAQRAAAEAGTLLHFPIDLQRLWFAKYEAQQRAIGSGNIDEAERLERELIDDFRAYTWPAR